MNIEWKAEIVGEVHVAVIDWDLGPSVAVNETEEGLRKCLALNADRMNGWQEGTCPATWAAIEEAYGDQTVTHLVAQVEGDVVPVNPPSALDYPPGYIQMVDRLAESDPDGSPRWR